MFSTILSAALLGLLAANCVQAHMFLATPVRFEQVPQVSSGPLKADGSNYPCQAGSSGTYTVKTLNTYPLGSSQTIAFIGEAVHGGGSGQAVLTYDTEPRPNSVFKVLKSFEGGFVAKGQTGNMGDNAASPDPFIYTFDVPKDLPAGNATIAITWFNKIGNREMYQMCAPVVLTGSGGAKANFDALPDMFKANIGTGCGTQDSMDVVFPDPGKIVERNNGATTAFATPTGNGCQAAGSRPDATAGPSGGAGGSGSSAAAGTATGGFSTASSINSAPTYTPAPPSASTSTAAVANSPIVTPAAPGTTAATKTTTAASPGNTVTGTGASFALMGSCTSEGQWNCIDGRTFQRCASGSWSVVMPVAVGTKCVIGSGEALTIASASKLRFRGVPFTA